MKFKKIKNPSLLAAKLLARGKILGWYQGRSEFGPRALGNRSILANPSLKWMKDKINKVDIVGLVLKKGGLQKDELGLIEVFDHASYAAVKRAKIQLLVQQIKNEKISNKKVKIEISR